MPPADPLIGRLLEGRYRILARIARGGMSTVYAAVDERLDRPVAVKIMASALSTDPVFVDRFIREARAAARLSHINAVAVYDQGRDRVAGAEHVFLVMELVRGRTLRELIRQRRGRFSAAEAISLIEPVLSALASAHRAGLAHRDIKPENVLLGDDGIVKVADFGLARAVDGDPAATSTGVIMGTVAYSAPEQITDGRADPRSDVYSVGVMLFELLTGRPPFEGDSAMAVAAQHVDGRVPPPSARAPGVPLEIDQLVLAATARNPARRPADAAIFLAEVADVRSRLRLPVVPVAPAPRVRRVPDAGPPSAPIPTLTAPSSLPTATARTAGPAVTTVMRPGRPPAPVGLLDRTVTLRPEAPPRTPQPRPVAEPRRRRRRIVLIILVLLGLAAVYGGWQATRWAQAVSSRVPSVHGQSVAQARTVLRQAGYRLGHESWSYSPTVQSGKVISTDPNAGERARQGSAIDLTVSRGQRRIAVPALRAMTRLTACAALSAHGLACAPTARSRPSPRFHKGTVVGSDPASGELVAPHARVTLIVSSGPPLVQVPEIAIGTSWRHAARLLRAAHLEPHRVLAYDSTVPAGDVVSVPSGTRPWGAVVRVVVSRGPQLVTIPSFDQGTNVGDVSSQLQALGLKVTVQTAEPGLHLGWFLKTTPPAGEQVPVGSTVVVDSI